jgi:hypothetical protein
MGDFLHGAAATATDIVERRRADSDTRGVWAGFSVFQHIRFREY